MAVALTPDSLLKSRASVQFGAHLLVRDGLAYWEECDRHSYILTDRKTGMLLLVVDTSGITDFQLFWERLRKYDDV